MKQIKVPFSAKKWIIVFLMMIGLTMLLYFGYRHLEFSIIWRAKNPLAKVSGHAFKKVMEKNLQSLSELIEMLHDENWEVREQAAYALGKIKDFRAVEPLIAALKNKDPGVRWTAAWALGEIGNKKAFEPLLSACTDPDNETNPDIESWIMRERILQEKASAKRSGDAYEGSIFSGVDIQREAVKSLIKIDQKEAKKRLIPLIEKQKRAGVLAAMEMNDCSYLGDLLNLLEGTGIADSDESKYRILDVRLALQRLACPELVNLYLFGKHFEHEERVIRDAVMGMDRDIVLDAALPALHNKGLAIRKRALDLADSFWDARVKAEVIGLLYDDEATIREKTMQILKTHEDPQLKNFLVEKLNDRSQSVREDAAETLLSMGDLRAVGMLISDAKDNSSCYNAECLVHWLGNIGNEEARQFLLDFLSERHAKDASTCSRTYYAALKLGELKEKRAIPLLSSLLREGNDKEKEAAKTALIKLGDTRFLPAILKELENSASSKSNDRYKQLDTLRALQDIASPFAAATLAKIYHAGPHWQDKDWAMDVLDTFDKCFSEPLIPVLKEQLQNPDPSIRIRVAEILGNSRNPKALAALKPAIYDSDWRVRRIAIKGLGENSFLSKRDLMQFILREPHWLTKSTAIAMLQKFSIDSAEIDALLKKIDAPFLIRQQLLRMKTDKIKSMDDEGSLIPLHLPSFITLNERGISQMDYDSFGNEFKENCFSGNSGYHHLVQSKNFVFVMNDHVIARLDRELNPANIAELGKIGACVSDRDLLYISANGYFLILDKDLNIISRLPVGIFSAHSKKMENVDDIAIQGNMAYLIDNKSNLDSTLKIDIAESKRPKIVQETGIEFVSQHLDAQWIASEQNEWRIIQSSIGMNGASQWLLKFSLISGKLKDNIRLFKAIENSNPWRRYDGWIEAVDPNSPEWMVIWKDNEYFLGRLSMETGELLKKGLLSLGVYADSESRREKHWKMKCNGDLIFIFNDLQLWVILIGDKPEILVYQKFGEKILDMVFSKSVHD
jgi:HEAT repeat protein